VNAAASVSAALRIRSIDPRSDPATAAASADLPGATVFHSPAWSRALHAAYGFRTRILIASTADGTIEAALPVTELPVWPRGVRGVSLPFADFCPILSRGADARHFLQAAMARHAADSGWRCLELRGDGALSEGAASTRFHGHALCLDPGDSPVPAGAAPSVRRAVRKAVRSGVAVEFSHDESALRRFHALYCRTRRRHGSPPAPWGFFAAMSPALIAPGLGFVALATRSGRDLAGAVFLRHGQRALYKYGASDPDHHAFRPNHLLMADSAAHLARQGCVELHLGRTSVGAEGLRRYKLSWGAVEHDIAYTRLDPRNGRPLPAPDRAGTWPTHLFRRLPLPVLRAIGAFLHPRIT